MVRLPIIFRYNRDRTSLTADKTCPTCHDKSGCKHRDVLLAHTSISTGIPAA